MTKKRVKSSKEISSKIKDINKFLKENFSKAEERKPFQDFFSTIISNTLLFEGLIHTLEEEQKCLMRDLNQSQSYLINRQKSLNSLGIVQSRGSLIDKLHREITILRNILIPLQKSLYSFFNL